MRLPNLLPVLVTVVALSTSTLVGRAHAQEPARVVEPPVGAKYELYNDQRGAEVLVPLVVQPGVTPASASVFEVRVGERRDQTLLSAFTCTLVPGNLKLTVKPGALTEPATYVVGVVLRGMTRGGALPSEIRQPLSVEMTLAPAMLRVIPPVIIERSLLDRGQDQGALLTLFNDARRTSLAPVRIEQLDGATNGGRPTEVRLVAQLAPATILPPGQSLKVPLVVQGTMLGTTRGQLQVAGPQLTAGVNVPFEVRIRLTPWLILPVFLMGGALGFLMRVYLARREARLVVAVQAVPLRRRLKEELVDPPAEASATALREALRALDEAVEARDDVAGLRAAVDASTAALQQAHEAREARRARAVEALERHRQVLARSWRLPQKARLEPALAAMRAAEERLAANDARGLDAALASIDAALGELRKQAVEWKDLVEAAHDRLLTHAPAPAQPSLQALSGARQELSAALTGDAAGARDWLQAVETLEGALLALRGTAALLIIDEAEEIEELLQDDGQYASSRKAATDARESARAAGQAGDGLQVALGLERAVTTLRQAATNVIGIRAGRARLDEGQLAEGVREALAEEPRKDVRFKSATARRPVILIAPPAPEAAPRAAEVSPAGLRYLEPSMAPLRAEDLFARAALDLGRVRWMRGVFSVLGLSVLAFIAYGDTWVGTPREILAVFGAAFTSDFTVEAVMDAIASRVKAPG